MGSGCGVGQAVRSESDSAGIAAGLRRPEETSRESEPGQSKGPKSGPAQFLEFVAPGAKAITNCTVEVETAKGSKLRLELKAVPTTELSTLIRSFVND